jgi:hypothetical protein
MTPTIRHETMAETRDAFLREVREKPRLAWRFDHDGDARFRAFSLFFKTDAGLRHSSPRENA